MTPRADGGAPGECARALDDEGGLVEGAAAPPGPLARAMYREMKRVRLLDERMLVLQRQGRVGFYGSCTGQEAPPVATALALGAGDWVFPALREGAVMLARGFPLERYVAQVFGNALDVLKGRQMPSHMSAREVRQVAWSSCIGTQLPQAVGAAWAAKLRRDPVAVVAFLGDGATSAADFHHAMNFAAVFRAPVVFVCQNNHWSISVPVSRQTASETLAVKARAYGMRGERVDGNDAFAVHAAVAGALARARGGLGPSFVECVTYRLGPHSSSDDPTRYRSDAEVEAWRRRDPLPRLRRYLERAGLFTEADERALVAELDAAIARAIEVAEAAPPPARETLFDDVYAAPPWHLREQRDELLRLPPAPRHGPKLAAPPAPGAARGGPPRPPFPPAGPAPHSRPGGPVGRAPSVEGRAAA
ncbi:MAG TPA: thiamine pyrophosphate-dependent enzyme [Polyangiaceae bacterium]|nr:thiamine pyrophosphate-dependent enzyme [Polyangiaceae bacterium]